MYRLSDCQSQSDFFYTKVNEVLSIHAPTIVTRVKNNDKPWITASFKQLVSRRNRAWKAGSADLLKSLRNQVNRCRKSLRSQYYQDQVEHLKIDQPHNWWHDVKRLCDITTNDNNRFNNVTDGDTPLDPTVLPDAINNFLLSVTEQICPIDVNALSDIRRNLIDVPECFIVSEFSVFNSSSSFISDHRSISYKLRYIAHKNHGYDLYVQS